MEELARIKPEHEQYGTGKAQGRGCSSAKWEKSKTIYNQEIIPLLFTFTFLCSTNINHQMSLGRQYHDYKQRGCEMSFHWLLNVKTICMDNHFLSIIEIIVMISK